MMDSFNRLRTNNRAERDASPVNGWATSPDPYVGILPFADST